MKFPTAITVILVAVTSIASAEPERAETSGRVGYKDGHDALQDDQAQGWALIATPTPANHGTEIVMVGDEAGPIAQLRIDAKGYVIVNRVKVYYGDGTSRNYDVERHLGPHRASVVVDLTKAKAIDRVVVTTETYTHGSYKIYGSSGTTVAGN